MGHWLRSASRPQRVSDSRDPAVRTRSPTPTCPHGPIRNSAAKGLERGRVEEGDLPDPVHRPARRHCRRHGRLAPAGAATRERDADGPQARVAIPSGRRTRGGPGVPRPRAREDPDSDQPVRGYQFSHWEQADKPTHEAMGLKAIPGADPQEVIARVMDVDRYPGHIAHVETCRLEQDPTSRPPEGVHFYQVIRVPAVARVHHELVLVDAGTVQGYRVAYWYLLKDRTRSLDPRVAAQRIQHRGVVGGSGSRGLCAEQLASAGRCERAPMGLFDLRRRCAGEEGLRGEHRRHGGVGEEAEGLEPVMETEMLTPCRRRPW